jgi:hypothetical protein
MRTISPRLFSICMVLILLTLACNIGTPIPAQQPAGQVETAVAQTLAAQQALTPLVTQVIIVVTSTSQEVPPPPAVTEPPPVPSEAPVVATTEPPGEPMVSVTVDTNCRYGPGPDYHIVGALLVGESVKVYGKNDRGDWWYIANSKRPGEFCWIWGQYAQVEGDKAAIAVATPPPVYFTIAYSTHADCEAMGGVETFGFTVKNIGSLKLESGTASVVRKSDGHSLMNAGYPFEGQNHPFRPSICAAGESALASGNQSVISVVAETPVDSTPARVTVRLCTQDGLGGYCYERTIDFTIG